MDYIIVLLDLTIIGLVVYIIRLSNKAPKIDEVNLDQLSRVKVKRSIFARPSGKKMPKINDDEASWRKENDEPADPNF